MASCNVVLTGHQRKILQLLLENESMVVEQCRTNVKLFSDLLMHLQCVNHHHNPEEHILKCTEFIRNTQQMCQTMDDGITACVNVPETAIQTAMTCDCICIQAACFRILYKWIPELDSLRMKRLKVKALCCESVIHDHKKVVEICTKIESIAQKIVAKNT